MWFGGGLGWFGVFWGGLGCFHGPVYHRGSPIAKKKMSDRPFGMQRNISHRSSYKYSNLPAEYEQSFTRDIRPPHPSQSGE